MIIILTKDDLKVPPARENLSKEPYRVVERFRLPHQIAHQANEIYVVFEEGVECLKHRTESINGNNYDIVRLLSSIASIGGYTKEFSKSVNQEGLILKEIKDDQTGCKNTTENMGQPNCKRNT